MAENDKSGEEPSVVRAEIRRVRVMLDPSHDLFHVELTRATGGWNETYGSEEAVRAFLRGAEAGASLMSGRLQADEIPREPTRTIGNPLAE